MRYDWRFVLTLGDNNCDTLACWTVVVTDGRVSGTLLAITNAVGVMVETSGWFWTEVAGPDEITGTAPGPSGRLGDRVLTVRFITGRVGVVFGVVLGVTIGDFSTCCGLHGVPFEIGPDDFWAWPNCRKFCIWPVS